MTQEINIKPLCSPNADIDGTSTKINLGDLLAVRGRYYNEIALFIAHFNTIPNLISEIDIDCKNANHWFTEKYDSEIRKNYFLKRYFNGSEQAELDDVFYILFDDLMVNLDSANSTVRFLFSKTDIGKVDSIIKEIKRFKKRNNKAFITLLIKTNSGFDTKSLEITKPNLCIRDNYNDDFKDVHNTIQSRLVKPNDKGIVLLHGIPGTGKTSYIRYLISSIKKKVVFLPPNMANAITNPDLISVLTDNPNSIFVIEDAENIVVDRERDGNSPVSTLLNISDGLLSDCLSIQIICSFNTDLSRVDPALMRKGRLIAKYEFKELETDKARSLSEKLGFNTQIDSPMTLTSIYNQEEKEFLQTKKTNPIGFSAISESSLGEN